MTFVKKLSSKIESKKRRNFISIFDLESWFLNQSYFDHLIWGVCFPHHSVYWKRGNVILHYQCAYKKLTKKYVVSCLIRETRTVKLKKKDFYVTSVSHIYIWKERNLNNFEKKFLFERKSIWRYLWVLKKKMMESSIIWPVEGFEKDFEIISKISEGKFGQVYRAKPRPNNVSRIFFPTVLRWQQHRRHKNVTHDVTN